MTAQIDTRAVRVSGSGVGQWYAPGWTCRFESRPVSRTDLVYGFEDAMHAHVNLCGVTRY